MFEGDSEDTCGEEFPLMSMGGRAEGLACADPGATNPIGMSRNLFYSSTLMQLSNYISAMFLLS